MPVDKIRVGQRHRKDMGDIAAFAASMAELGLLQAIGVTPGGMLIWGARRLRAAQLLGWKTIPVTVKDIDPEDAVRCERAENECRKDFTLSEAVAIKRALEPLEKAAARERMFAGTPSENFSKGRALDKVATVVGKQRTTIAKAEAIVDAAEAEPERFGKLLERMDRTGRVNGMYRLFKIQKQAEAIRAEPPPIPGRGPYRVGVVDPPWPCVRYDDPSNMGALPYPPMSIEQICALEVASIMHDDSLLWLWTTNFHLVNGNAVRVLTAWGFAGKTMLTWAKPRSGTGSWLYGQTEQCILATRGKAIVTLTNESTLLIAPAGRHSAKPVEFYDLVESLCPAPRYADLFARYRHNEKWDCHGDEAPKLGREAAE
jgi:N6-adenosine-specific RNA methylase IME4